MSRCNYDDDCCDLQDIALWRQAVKQGIEGKRGQSFLKEMLTVLDAMPVKELIEEELERVDGKVCAIGAVGKARGMDMSALDPEEADQIAKAFKISSALVREIEYINDEQRWATTPAIRFELVRKWVMENLHEKTPV